MDSLRAHHGSSRTTPSAAGLLASALDAENVRLVLSSDSSPATATLATWPCAHGEEVDDRLVQIFLDGNTFVVSDRANGDIEASLTDPDRPALIRHPFPLEWVLTIDGQAPQPLSVDDLHYFETRFFLVPGTGTVYVDAKLSVIRPRAVGGRVPRDDHDPQPRRPPSTSTSDRSRCDFADLFEVKDALAERGNDSARVENGRLAGRLPTRHVHARNRDHGERHAGIDDDGLTFAVKIEPHGRWSTELHVVAILFPGLYNPPATTP